LKVPQLQELLQWDEATFLNMTEGSAIRRIGHARCRIPTPLCKSKCLGHLPIALKTSRRPIRPMQKANLKRPAGWTK
jgi:epoxyqueuosine reductase